MTSTSTRTSLTAERLRELFDYDRITGIFRRKVERGGRLAGSIAGSRHKKGYLHIWLDGRQYKAHRLAWLYVYGKWPDGQIDHEDTVKDHNWIDNLRPATNAQNCANGSRRRNNTSGFKGVSRSGGKWKAQIGKGGNIYLGLYDTPEAAHAAYVEHARKLFGEFANDGL